MVARTDHRKRKIKMSKIKLIEIVSHLWENAKKLQYGSASLILIVHSNKIKRISFETTECVKEKEEIKE